MTGPVGTIGVEIAGAGGANQDQIEYWNSPTTAHWVEQQEQMDRLLAPLTAHLLERAAARAGESAIDVGCGCGETTLALARAVGPTGHVLGVDVSRPMLTRAQERAAREELLNIELELADASIYSFRPAAADLLVSRFGVMFFRNPEAAFANLRLALRPSGRLAFMAWLPLSSNPWFAAPLAAARALLPNPPPLPEEGEPGPFAFGDRTRVERILGAAGWTAVELERCDAPMRLGAPGGAAEAARRVTSFGPVARALAGAPQALRERVAEAVAARLTAHDGPDGITLAGSVWLVSARPQ